MANTIFKKLCNPSDVAFNKLYFVNLLNNAGCDNKPVKFKTYFEAAKACPSLAKICERLTNKELQSLIDRIENIL